MASDKMPRFEEPYLEDKQIPNTVPYVDYIKLLLRDTAAIA